MALEQAEQAKRQELNKHRLPPPHWPDVDNSDPWYDGRSPIHDYTIVASPRIGTVLDVDAVVHILQCGDWLREPARPPTAE